MMSNEKTEGRQVVRPTCTTVCTGMGQPVVALPLGQGVTWPMIEPGSTAPESDALPIVVSGPITVFKK